MAKRKTGRFITFEGTEGAGKSTLIAAVETALVRRGIDCVRTREPGGNPTAEKIREVILSSAMNPWTELFLYEAARAEHLAQTILPALAAGKVVLCDRFTDSSLAYQGQGRGLPWKQIQALNEIATQGLEPDLTVWLDIDPAEGLSHAREITRFEKEGVIFQSRVRQGFARARRESPARWLKLQARSATPEALAEKVVEAWLKQQAKIATKKAPRRKPNQKSSKKIRTGSPRTKASGPRKRGGSRGRS